MARIAYVTRAVFNALLNGQAVLAAVGKVGIAGSFAIASIYTR